MENREVKTYIITTMSNDRVPVAAYNEDNARQLAPLYGVTPGNIKNIVELN